MEEHSTTGTSSEETSAGTWERPEIEVICLACEISAYAPADEGPLF